MPTTSIALFRPASSTRRRGFLARVFDLMALNRQRRALEHMPDHILTDIGLTRREAQNEAARPLWDAPNHWQR